MIAAYTVRHKVACFCFPGQVAANMPPGGRFYLVHLIALFRNNPRSCSSDFLRRTTRSRLPGPCRTIFEVSHLISLAHHDGRGAWPFFCPSYTQSLLSRPVTLLLAQYAQNLVYRGQYTVTSAWAKWGIVTYVFFETIGTQSIASLFELRKTEDSRLNSGPHHARTIGGISEPIASGMISGDGRSKILHRLLSLPLLLDSQAPTLVTILPPLPEVSQSIASSERSSSIMTSAS